MLIALTAEQEACLKDRVSRGEFVSIEDAARRLIDDGISMLDQGSEADLLWAVPLVAEGVAALERGETISLSEHTARNADRLAARDR